LREISEKLKAVTAGSVAIVASARQTNEELYLLSKLARKTGAITDSVPRAGEGDKLLLNADRNPNSTGARLTGIAAEPMGSKLPKIAEGIRNGQVKILIVFGEDVTVGRRDEVGAMAKAVQVFWGDARFLSACAPSDRPLPAPFTIYLEIRADGTLGTLLMDPETKVGNCIRNHVANRKSL